MAGQLAKTTETLSSGYKINRAADDAAGLSISEKMRRQIRGLAQASDNIGDGISLCQVADGALNETADILQRMRVLAVQSANGTYSERDRQFIDLEVARLKSEVDRIAEETSFNDGIYPLKGVSETADVPPGSNPAGGVFREIALTVYADRQCTYEGTAHKSGEGFEVKGLTTNGTEIWFRGGSAFTDDGIWGNYGGFHDYTDSGPLKISDLQSDGNGYLHYSHKGQPIYAVYVFPQYVGVGHNNPDPVHFEDEFSARNTVNTGKGRFMTADDLNSQQQTVTSDSSRCDDVIIQAGADSGEQIPIRLVNATCKALGITDLTVSTQESSAEAMGLLNEAISKVTTYRSVFGVTQNRLECAKRVDDNTAENTQAAESGIRDTDMAAAMVMYANADILMQAGQSMLSQANKSRQDVSRLLEFS